MKNSPRTPTRTGASTGRPSRQRALIMAGLMGSLALVSVLLLALAPAPLKRQRAIGLMALEPVDGVFRTDVPVNSGRWKSIYIHQSKTPAGNEQTLAIDADGPADHFLIGNGEGAEDGEILVCQRWLGQMSAGTHGIRVPDGCISIAIIGDLDQTAPTSAQMRRLGDLVKTLQDRLGIPTGRILIQDSAASAAGIGTYFPRTLFIHRLQP